MDMGELDLSVRYPKLARLYRGALVLGSRMRKGIDGNKVVFSCLQGRFYGDSPRLISERLHQLRPGTDIVWVLEERAIKRLGDRLPGYIRTVHYRSRKSFEEHATARVWVDNFTKQVVLKPVKGKQFYIQTWHGDRAIKRIGYDVGTSDLYRVEELCDRVVTASTFGENMFRTAFRYNGEYIRAGSPRNDILVRNDPRDIRRVREGLNVPEGVRLLLYAPTYRENEKVVPKRAQMDLARTLRCLEQTTGAPWRCLYRAHYLSQGIDLEAVKDRIIDVTRYEEMSELLLAADMVLTDYSSCALDFIVRDLPALFYIADWDEYVSTRKVYFDIRETPMLTAANQDELEALIRGMTPEKARENCAAIRDHFGYYETGRATEAVVEHIIRRLDQ